MSPVTVVAILRSQPESAPVVRAELLRLLEPTRAEQGCLNYDLFEDPADPALFIFHENWTSHAELDRHLESSHIQACLGVIESLLESAEVRRLTQLDVR
jgi:quinol monooxygenase YgiN